MNKRSSKKINVYTDETLILPLLTSESKIQRPTQQAPIVKVVLNVWSKDSSNKNEYKLIKQLIFSSVKAAIKHKYIYISSDLYEALNIDYITYEIFIDGNLVESGKYKDLKNSTVKDYIDFAKEIDKAEPVTN